MCRPKELGGRRCPQHTDPIKHAAYNTRRRELYSLKKNGSKGLVSFFPAFNAVKYSLEKVDDPLREQHRIESEVFATQLRAGLVKAVEQAKANPDQETSDFDEEMEKKEKFYKALDWYTGNGYNVVRDYLNDGQLAPYNGKNHDYENEDAKMFIPILDEALSKAVPPEKPRVLYRGMNLPYGVKEKDIEKWLGTNFPVGGTISQKSYMSTTFSGYMAVTTFSKDYDKDESIMFEIVSRKGAALGVGTSAWGLEESEVLMPRETKFKIVSIHRNQELNVRYFADSPNGVSDNKRTVIRLIDVED